MNFEDFVKKKQVRKGQIDRALAKSLIEAASRDIDYLKTQTVSENSARKIISNYYDVLRSIVEAITALEGYKVYSHEAYTYYLKENVTLNASKQFDRFRKIRNNINYYGEIVEVEEAKDLINSIISLIEELKIELDKRMNQF